MSMMTTLHKAALCAALMLGLPACVSVSVDDACEFEKAAAQGDTAAQYSLGVCYYNGEGVGRDFAEAVKWFEKAAAQGDEDAQFALGVCYANGDGVGEDLSEAVRWFEKADGQGHENWLKAHGMTF